MDTLKEISKFLNVPAEKIQKLPFDLVVKMSKAIEDGDYMKLHWIGYEVKVDDNL